MFSVTIHTHMHTCIHAHICEYVDKHRGANAYLHACAHRCALHVNIAAVHLMQNRWSAAATSIQVSIELQGNVQTTCEHASIQKPKSPGELPPPLAGSCAQPKR